MDTPMAIEAVEPQINARIVGYTAARNETINEMVSAYSRYKKNTIWFNLVKILCSDETYRQKINAEIDQYIAKLNRLAPLSFNEMFWSMKVCFQAKFIRENYDYPIAHLSNLLYRVSIIKNNSQYGVKSEFSEIIILSEAELALLHDRI